MKKCYIITFELKNPGLNRDKIIAEIKTASCVRVSADAYLITSHNDSVTIRDILLKHLFQGDKIYVGKLDNFAAWYGLDTNTSNWITGNQK